MSIRQFALAAFGLSLLGLACGVSVTAFGQTSGIESIIARLPRAFVGEFRWDGDRQLQDVAIRFDTVRRLDDGRVVASGCGIYDVAGKVTSIDVTMHITVPDLQVEIWEASPDKANFVTDGSHRGALSGDLRAIDAEWTTASTGQRGQLRLRAAPEARCAPARPS
jgi:hypothetical protein